MTLGNHSKSSQGPVLSALGYKQLEGRRIKHKDHEVDGYHEKI